MFSWWGAATPQYHTLNLNIWHLVSTDFKVATANLTDKWPAVTSWKINIYHHVCECISVSASVCMPTCYAAGAGFLLQPVSSSTAATHLQAHAPGFIYAILKTLKESFHLSTLRAHCKLILWLLAPLSPSFFLPYLFATWGILLSLSLFHYFLFFEWMNQHWSETVNLQGVFLEPLLKAKVGLVTSASVCNL